MADRRKGSQSAVEGAEAAVPDVAVAVFAAASAVPHEGPRK